MKQAGTRTAGTGGGRESREPGGRRSGRPEGRIAPRAPRKRKEEPFMSVSVRSTFGTMASRGGGERPARPTTFPVPARPPSLPPLPRRPSFPPSSLRNTRTRLDRPCRKVSPPTCARSPTRMDEGPMQWAAVITLLGRNSEPPHCARRRSRRKKYKNSGPHRHANKQRTTRVASEESGRQRGEQKGRRSCERSAGPLSLGGRPSSASGGLRSPRRCPPPTLDVRPSPTLLIHPHPNSRTLAPS